MPLLLQCLWYLVSHTIYEGPKPNAKRPKSEQISTS